MKVRLFKVGVFSILLFLLTACSEKVDVVTEPVTTVEDDKIKVELNIKANFLNNQEVTVTGNTNLPDKTILHIKLYNAMETFVSEESIVVSDGLVTTGNLLKEDEKLELDMYVLEVTSPIISEMPEEVQEALGDKGSKMRGRHIHSDRVFGKRIYIKEVFMYEEKEESIEEDSDKEE